MKRIVISAGILMLSICSAFAQDKVITTDGDVIEAYRIDVGSTHVYYTTEDKDDASLKKIAKADVLMIRKKDGTKISVTEFVPDKSTNQAAPSERQEATGITQVKYEDLSAKAKEENDALIASINAPVELVFKEKHQEDVGKDEANYAYACFGVKEGTIVCNEDVEISIVLGCLTKRKKSAPAEWSEGSWSNNPAIMFRIKNKTNQTIYLDLGNTFYIMMGQPVCYYTPSSTTTSNTSSGGGSLNLGAVAGALGVGGMAGTLANGVNVGGGSSNTSTSTIYAQRVVAIPPMSAKDLDPQYLFGNDEKSICTGCLYSTVAGYTYNFHTCINFNKKSPDGPMMLGDHYKYAESDSPIQMSFVVTYSKTENCTSSKSLTSHYYLKDLLGRRVAYSMRVPGGYYDKGEISRKDLPYFTARITDKDEESFPR